MKKNRHRSYTVFTTSHTASDDHPDGCKCHYTRNIKKHTGSEHKVAVPTSGLLFYL
jgi:hypothetical protein